MPNNSNLNKAKKVKKDEFYTQFDMVEKELMYYKKHLKNKIVLCNCDNPETSAFWEYFHLNFADLGLKKLISTYYNEKGISFKTEYVGGDDKNIKRGTKTSLNGNGDFRSDECLNILDKCDIVVTNPPFSLFRDYIDVMTEHKKKFLIIGNMNAMTYKQIFPLFKKNLLWYGASIHSVDRKFYVPDDYPLNAWGCGIDENGKRFIRVKGVRWFTNFDYPSRHNLKLELQERYVPEKYPKYDDYDAINVNKVAEIPVDYDGVMGVPITFMDKYDSEQFEILGMASSWDTSDEVKAIRTASKCCSGPILNGNELYKRILIRKK